MISNCISGWFFLDKPIGITSNSVLQKIRKVFNKSKAGFVGTLDPLASGFLPIALGPATKIIPYIENNNKKYSFTIKWGTKTETGDSEGKVLQEKKKYPKEIEIINALRLFKGTIEQTPHQYSSIKVNGLRAYRLARNNIPFKLKKRKINVYHIELIKIISRDLACFAIECSAGTYIRSLAESLAESLGTLGSITELRRVGFGHFDKKVISLDYLLSLVHSDDLNKLVHPVDAVFIEAKKIQLDKDQVKKVLTGSFIEMDKHFVETIKDKMVFAKHDNNFIALGSIIKSNFHPKKLLIT